MRAGDRPSARGRHRPSPLKSMGDTSSTERKNAEESERRPAPSRGGARDKLTPVMRQWDDAKRAHPDAVLFFRLGDFYEMFHEDAVLVSNVLKLTLTSRNKGAADEIPMAGVPYHAAHGYIAKMLAAGYKVALCEQMADPSKVKGIVPREVVRVVTPGLVTDGEIEARENLFLAAVDASGEAEGERRFGVALLDLSTGELAAASVVGSAALTCEIVRASPREVLFGPGAEDVARDLAPLLRAVALREDGPLELAPAELVARELGEEARDEAAKSHDLLALTAAARVLSFARRCTPNKPLPVRRVATLDLASVMRIDETAQAHLELVRAMDGSREGTLLAVLDRAVTPSGARLLRQRLLAPLTDVGAIRRRLDEVEAFVVHARARAELLEVLREIGDLERLAVRATLGDATPRDLGAIRDGLLAAPKALDIVRSLPAADAEMLGAEALDPLFALSAELSRALVERPPPIAREGGLTAEGYDEELDHARRTKRDATQLLSSLEARLREETSSNLKIRYNNVFGHYIEVTKSQLGRVPSEWRRKQTVAGGERYTNDALDQLAADIESAEGRALERELAVFAKLVGEVVAVADRIRKLARGLAAWDVAASLADVAHRHDFVRPDVDDGDLLDIEEGRHAVVEQHAAKGRFVPNDTRLDLGGQYLWLVTGPNMAGKSTLMRQVALIVVLAQMGSYVPAKRARVGVVDRLLSRVGASDNLARGESTFMVEMRETAAILRNATRRSLVILDEIGRGTSTYDGLSIAWAVAEHLAGVTRSRALFATHYHELTELARTSEGVANVSVSAREHEGGVLFLHTLAKGPASRSYGIAVARLAGLPDRVLSRAREILASLEGEGPPVEGPSPRRRGSTAQLDLFGAGRVDEARPSKVDPKVDALLRALREVDPDRTTPLEALTLIARWKKALDPA